MPASRTQAETPFMLLASSPGRELGLHPGDHLGTRQWLSTTTLREHFRGFAGPGRACDCILFGWLFLWFLSVEPCMGRGAGTGQGGECWITSSFEEFLGTCSELFAWGGESLSCPSDGQRSFGHILPSRKRRRDETKGGAGLRPQEARGGRPGVHLPRQRRLGVRGQGACSTEARLSESGSCGS